MRLKQHIILGASILGLALLSGCWRSGRQSESGSADPAKQAGGAANLSGRGGLAAPEPGLSSKPELRFKRQALLKADLASALDMKPEELCQEFGKSCLDDLYNLALGGVDPYQNQIVRGIQQSVVTTPIVLERVVLAACSERARRDVRERDGAIFKDLPLSGDGNLTDVNDPKVAAAIDVLYKRSVQRPASEEDVRALRELYTKVQAKSQAGAAEKWAGLACYAVLTSLEAVFH